MSQEMDEAKLKKMFLTQKQSLPLNAKISLAKRKIKEWYDANEGMVYVAFSGGKDSQVLLHLVRSMYPDVPAVFADTGLEMPEIRSFVRTFDNVVWVKPVVNFRKVLQEYGYPVVSKKVAKMIRRLQNPTDKNAASNHLSLTGIKRDGTKTAHFKLADKWRHLQEAPFKISEKCCDIMKKNPMHEYEKQTKRKPYVGTMASDSQFREKSYLKTGCNSFSTGQSKPLSIWLEQDIWDYIKQNGLEYSKAYDMGEGRTGCMFCMFGFQFDPMRFERMRQHHPKLYNYCMFKLGLGDVLKYTYGYTKHEQLHLF